MAIQETLTTLPVPERPYLKDDRDPNAILDELHREIFGDSFSMREISGLQPRYMVPEIVTFDPSWMDPATGLMVNVPALPDFLSSFRFQRRHASLAIGTYAVDLSYSIPEGGRGSGGTWVGDAILRFSISRTQIRQELPRERTAVIRSKYRIVEILDKHGEKKQVWLPYRTPRTTEEGTVFDTAWRRRTKKAQLKFMPETLGELFFDLSMVFSVMIRSQGLDPYDDDFLWTAELAHQTNDAEMQSWMRRLTGAHAYAIWHEAVTHRDALNDLSKAERCSEECRGNTQALIRRMIDAASDLKQRYDKSNQGV